MLDFNRQPNESTSEFLGRVLDEVGLSDMANRARAYHFDDYLCPEDIDDGMNINHLVMELTHLQVTASIEKAHQIQEIVIAAKDGVFDGTKEESEAWGASEDGQRVFRNLIGGKDD